VEAKLFLILHGRHCRDNLEVMMQRGDAHPNALGQLFDAQRSSEVLSKPRDGLSNLVAGGLGHCDLKQPRTAWAGENAVQNFLLD
jgi:hypothetical protein